MNEEKENLIVFLWKIRKALIVITGIGAVLSLVVSFLITPQFLSTAIIFPTATSTVSFSEQRNAKASSMDFGEAEQAEQMLQILQSSRIRDLIVKRFDLMNHYEIKPNDPYKDYKMGKAYNEHISCTRTRYESIEIDVWDKDPQMAADIANKIVDLYDTVKNQMIKERTIPAFQINVRKKKLIDESLRRLDNKLDSLSNLGVVTSEARANLFRAYNDAKSAADKAYFKKQIDANTKFGAEYDGLEALRDERMVKLSEFEAMYEQAESDANANFTQKFVVESAVKADKKDKPKKALIVLISTFATFFFAIFYFLIVARIKELKKIA